jgi:hypothetical protein
MVEVQVRDDLELCSSCKVLLGAVPCPPEAELATDCAFYISIASPCHTSACPVKT